MVSPELVLIAVGTLLLKHAVADFILQTGDQAANKGRYGHIAGLTHAATHVVLTPTVFLVLKPASPALAVLILVTEFVWHYHQDWLKDQVTRGLKLAPDRNGFWWGIGIDQFVHQVFYLLVVYVLIYPQRLSALGLHVV